MKSYGGLFEPIVAVENLRAATRAAVRGNQDSPPVAAFLADLEERLPPLHRSLVNGSYRPGPYRQFRIRDPKPRTISCAPFRDRVLHHAICDLVGPLIERRFIADSFACRVGKGSHRAVLGAQTFCRRYRYFCKLDVRAFFDSVDHHTLNALLMRQFRERRLRELLALIVAQPVPGNPRGKGLPIGNLTSQWFANLYLDGVDHLAKEDLQVPGYLRYMDDMVLWSDSKAQLWSFADAVRGYLREQRQLALKERACVLAPVSEGLSFLGMRIFPGRLRLQRRRWQRSRRLLRRREEEFAAGELSDRALADSVRSIAGGLRPFGLRNVLRSGIEL